MRAALLYGIGDLRLVDVPTPEYGPDEVLTKVTVCAVCPTDIRKYRVGNGGVLQFPFNMGHEWVGEVVEVGKDVDDVKVGDRILGGGYAGYAEYAPVGGHNLRPVKGKPLVIPESVSDEEATFVEPLADAIHSIVDQGKVKIGDKVLILGAGQLALQHVMVAKAVGATVIVSEPIAERRELARQFGADYVLDGSSTEEVVAAVHELTDGQGADAAIVTIGSPEASVTALAAVRSRARIVLFGGFDRGVQTTLDLNIIHYKEIELTGSYWVGVPPYGNPDLYGVALKLIENGTVPVGKLITHRFELENIHDAFDAIRTKAGMKAIIYINKPLTSSNGATDK
ncbi:MAG: zinc-binding dehydrogenase [Thermomicrobiales bacterium]|nr:zinc-binding dehydrogenase [Thermomicrobiales bacterium]